MIPAERVNTLQARWAQMILKVEREKEAGPPVGSQARRAAGCAFSLHERMSPCTYV